ncbi:MAG: PKD domain-containing protein, partial [Bacteroidetes bacterium]|nr:PKD domain-containing protein [Bacteroidota bacterium]
FPVTSNAFQTTAGGGNQDGCIFKMDANLTNMIWSSYLGGNGADAIYGIVLDENEDIFVTGGTSSTNFPTTSGVLYPNYMGNPSDGFITKISKNGNSILKSTYYGSDAYDQSYLIERDKTGMIYVFGQTKASGNTFIHNTTFGTPNSGQFISKINPELNNLIWSTAFGTGSGEPDISPTAFLVDYCNKIYLSGWGGPIINVFGGTAGLPVTPDAFQLTTDDNDYYFMVIDDNATSLIYGSFFGSPHAAEHVDGGTSRFDRTGRIYQGVCGGCGGWSDFPTTPGAWSNTNQSTNCNNAVIKFDFNIPVVIAEFDIPSIGCVPYNAFFNNTSQTSETPGVHYFWDFGDGGTSVQNTPYHLFVNSGVYNVKLIVSDTGSCNIADTIVKQVVMIANTLDTLATKNICYGDFVQIGTLPLPDASVTYNWVPSTGLSDSNISNPIASPLVSTNYTLYISNGICTDTILQKVKIILLTIEAGHDTTICSGSVLLNATSTGGGTEYIWSTNHNLSDTLNNPLSNSSVIVSPATSTTYYVQVSNSLCKMVDSVHVNFAKVLINVSNDHNICKGDTSFVSVTNLNPADSLTYQWTPSTSIISGGNSQTAYINPIATTSYIVLATNYYGCQSKDTVTVQVLSIAANLSTDSVNCYGECNGSASVIPSGGIAPYSYQWSNDSSEYLINNLCAASYSVTITDIENCKLIVPVQIYSPQAIIAFISDTQMVSCNGICDGYAIVTTSGSTAPYSYLWIDGQTTSNADSLCAGNYSVTITDFHGCTEFVYVEITDTSNLAAIVNNIIEPSCYAYCDAISFAFVTGGTQPYTYTWDNGTHDTFTDSLCAGNHNLKVFDYTGCTRNVYYSISQPTPVIFTEAVNNNPSCKDICDGNIIVNANGGTPSYTYTWSNNQSGITATNLCDGTYYVTVYDSHNCTAN